MRLIKTGITVREARWSIATMVVSFAILAASRDSLWPLVAIPCGLLGVWVRTQEQPSPLLRGASVAALTCMLGVLLYEFRSLFT